MAVAQSKVRTWSPPSLHKIWEYFELRSEISGGPTDYFLEKGVRRRKPSGQNGPEWRVFHDG